jgi:hypothetical protein
MNFIRGVCVCGGGAPGRLLASLENQIADHQKRAPAPPTKAHHRRPERRDPCRRVVRHRSAGGDPSHPPQPGSERNAAARVEPCASAVDSVPEVEWGFPFPGHSGSGHGPWVGVVSVRPGRVLPPPTVLHSMPQCTERNGPPAHANPERALRRSTGLASANRGGTHRETRRNRSNVGKAFSPVQPHSSMKEPQLFNELLVRV